MDEPQPSPVGPGDGGSTDRVYVGLLALREATTDTYVELVDRVQTTPRLHAALALDGELAGLPESGQ